MCIVPSQTLLGPTLPPRISTRFRELSPSPSPHFFHRDNAPPSPHSNGSETPPPKPPRRLASPSSGEDGEREPSVERTEPIRRGGTHTHAPIIPYSVTTLTPVDSSHQAINDLRRSESPLIPIAMATIPPPAILQRSNEVSHPNPAPSPVVYYSIPEDGGRSLGDDGRFGPSSIGGRSQGEDGQLRSGGWGLSEGGQSRNGVSEDEPSRTGGRGSVAESESSHEEDEKAGAEDGAVAEEEEVLGKVTDVVKAVMELSDRVSLSQPDQYVELVKVSHMTCHMSGENPSHY